MDDLVEWLRVQFDEDERRIDCNVFAHASRAECDCDLREKREVEAKRQILEVTLRWMDAGYPTLDVQLRLLALPYSDRPGYREEWRP